MRGKWDDYLFIREDDWWNRDQLWHYVRQMINVVTPLRIFSGSVHL